jgi:hypothetical protein
LIIDNGELRIAGGERFGGIIDITFKPVGVIHEQTGEVEVKE